MDILQSIWAPIHREGYIFIGMFAAGTLVLFYSVPPLGWLGVILTFWCVTFFRDPERVTPQRKGILVSPADGIICLIDKAPPPPELNMAKQTYHRISIFMNVFNCHINRAPLAGTVRNIVYRPGKKFNASLDKASEHNERNSLHIKSDEGESIAVVQIAGLLAQRIITWIGEDRHLKAGERFGMIRFGSRVDLYFPESVKVLALEGQKSVAGETVLAEWVKKKSAATGSSRGRSLEGERKTRAKRQKSATDKEGASL